MSSYQILRNCIILSLLLHLFFGFSIARYIPVQKPKPPSIVELIESAPRKKTSEQREAQGFVRQADVPEKLKLQEKKPTRLASEKDQTVFEETRAAVSGMTENRQAEVGRISKSSPREIEKKKTLESKKEKIAKILDPKLTHIKPEQFRLAGDTEVQFDKAKDQPSEKPKSVPFPQIGGLGLRKGSSTVGETLPQDIKIGDFTALNTDRYTYYTFFARMEEVFRPKWINHVKAAFYAYQQIQRRPREEEFVTQLELLLDKDGNFIRGILHTGSGNTDLDLAPVKAFREAGRFPNPPQEMLKEDQLIHLEYQFTVHFVPQYQGTASE
jgi:hypothetical protein